MTVTTHSPHEGESHQRTYVACLNCGEELAYNWQKMKVEGRSRLFPVSSPSAVIPMRRRSMYQRLLEPESNSLRRVEAGR